MHPSPQQPPKKRDLWKFSSQSGSKAKTLRLWLTEMAQLSWSTGPHRLSWATWSDPSTSSPRLWSPRNPMETRELHSPMALFTSMLPLCHSLLLSMREPSLRCGSETTLMAPLRLGSWMALKLELSRTWLVDLTRLPSFRELRAMLTSR